MGVFAPKFAELNDDVLFGQVWAREEQLSARDRSIVTVTALMASGILDSSLQHHIQNAKKHGVTAVEMAELLTHAAFFTQAGPRPGPHCAWRRNLRHGRLNSTSCEKAGIPYKECLAF